MANYVTGFAVAQVLTTTFALVKKDIKPLRGRIAHIIAVVVSLCFTTGYILAISWCGGKGSVLLTGDDLKTWSIVTEGRIATVIFFTFVLFMALIDHWRHEQLARSKAPPQTMERL